LREERATIPLLKSFLSSRTDNYHLKSTTTSYFYPERERKTFVSCHTVLTVWTQQRDLSIVVFDVRKTLSPTTTAM